MLADYLGSNGFALEVASTGRAGLALVRRIARLHGGDASLVVTGSQSVGATIVLSLPANGSVMR